MKKNTQINLRGCAWRTILVMVLVLASRTGFAQALGDLSNYALFAGTGALANTGAGSAIIGNIGTNVGAISGYVSGSTGNVTGTINGANPVTLPLATAVEAIYQSLLAWPLPTVPTPAIAPAMVGMTLTPGVYVFGGAASVGGTLTLSGAGTYIFKINGALSVAAASHVVLTNGADASKIFWQVYGAATIGANSTFAGTIVADGAIYLADGTTLNGRALATVGAITTYNSHVTVPPVVVPPVVVPPVVVPPVVVPPVVVPPVVCPLPIAIPRNVTVVLGANGSGTLAADNVTSTNCATLTYQLQKVVYGQVDEHQLLTLTAPVGEVFTAVTFASYGRPTGNNGIYAIGGCHATNSNAVVEKYVLGKNTATIFASNDIFGDPCYLTFKSLAVQALCSLAPLVSYTRTDMKAPNYVLLTVTDAANNKSTAMVQVTVTDLFATRSVLATPAALTAAEVTLYPNPTHAAFTVLVPAVAEADQVQAKLFNTLGQVVRQQAAALPAAGAHFVVETADLAAGIYTLRLQMGTTTVTKRVVIQ